MWFDVLCDARYVVWFKVCAACDEWLIMVCAACDEWLIMVCATYDEWLIMVCAACDEWLMDHDVSKRAVCCMPSTVWGVTYDNDL